MKITAIILFVMVSLLFAKGLEEFPLWGQTWIIGEGENSWIYPSAARFRPQKVALVTFNTDTIDIRYANLETCPPMYSTAEAINEMMKQFDKEEKEIKVSFDEINTEYSSLQIEYYPYNDTTWSLHSYAERLSNITGYTYTKYILRFGTKEVECDGEVFSDDENSEDDKWTTTKPLLTTYREARAEDVENFDTSVVAVSMDCDTSGKNCTEIYVPKGVDAMNIDEYASQLIKRPFQVMEIIEYHPCDVSIGEYETKNIGFWRLHVAPEVWFTRRNRDGSILSLIDSVEMWRNGSVYKKGNEIYAKSEGEHVLGLPYREAMNKRKAMVEKSGSGVSNSAELGEVTIWINPVLSSVASTIVSVSFRGDVENFGDKIFLDSQDPDMRDSVNNKLYFAHNPPRMYRVDNNKIEQAAIKLHAQNNLEEEEAKNLLDCPNWKYTDSITSTYIFPEYDSIGNRIISRKKSKKIDESVYMYDGCPCDTIRGIGATPMELRRYIYKPMLTHSLDIAKDVNRVFRALSQYLTAGDYWIGNKKMPGDKTMLENKITQSQIVVDELEKAYKKIYGNSPYPVLEKRPKTWLDDEPIKRILRGY
jgi:hypothetical protein